MVQQHGGSISLEEGRTGGARFVIRLPLGTLGGQTSLRKIPAVLAQPGSAIDRRAQVAGPVIYTAPMRPSAALGSLAFLCGFAGCTAAASLTTGDAAATPPELTAAQPTAGPCKPRSAAGRRRAGPLPAAYGPDPDGDPIVLRVTGLPDGAYFDNPTRQLRFTPDFIQGGKTLAGRGQRQRWQAASSVSFPLTVRDTIMPPAPRIAASETVGAASPWRRNRHVSIVPAMPGASFRRWSRRRSMPADRLGCRCGWCCTALTVRRDATAGRGSPHHGGRPDEQLRWGYNEKLPAGSADGGTVPPYTLRRVLNLIDWALRTFPAIDPSGFTSMAHRWAEQASPR